MSTDRRRSLAAACLALAFQLCSALAFAGGTPEEAFLIIDPSDPVSMYVGNYYKYARNIPDANVLYMSSAAQNYDYFFNRQQPAFLGTLERRNIQDHLDYMSPPGATNSGLQATNGTYQLGWSVVGGQSHTGMWNGSPASFVDVNPSGATASAPNGMDPVPPFYYSVGYAVFDGVSHAGWWTTPGGQWTDLNPSATTSSVATAGYNGMQVGTVWVNYVSHAAVWFGGPSWVDLSASLPSYYMTGAAAYAIRADAHTAYILGNAQRADSSATDVIIWKLPVGSPTP
jgi:hypothetical protein